MVSKKILGVAIAAAFSAQAFATVDLNAQTGSVTIAKEAITNAQISSGMVQVTGGAANLSATAKLGFGVSAGAHAFIRFDLTNAKFKTAVAPADLTDTTTAGNVPAANVVVAQGGAAGDTYVIFDVTATAAGIPQADVLKLALATLQVSPTAPASLAYAHYSTSPNAVAQTSALANANATVATVANVLKTTISATNREADVSASPAFTKFVSPASTTATLGSVKFELGASGTVVDATNTAITTASQLFDNASGKSSLTIAGDLGFISKTDAATTATMLTFGGQNADVNTTSSSTVSTKKKGDLSNAAFALGATADIAVTANSAMSSNTYSLTASFTGVSDAAYTPAAVTGSLGSITRSGTTIQVPYVTTFADYNQRLVLVNRYGTAAPYVISFTKEAGVTTAAGAKSSGTLAPNETLILKATDIVTITGSTRTAATVVVTAPSGTVDAATTTVNLADKSTDTVKLN